MQAGWIQPPSPVLTSLPGKVLVLPVEVTAPVLLEEPVVPAVELLVVVEEVELVELVVSAARLSCSPLRCSAKNPAGASGFSPMQSTWGCVLCVPAALLVGAVLSEAVLVQVMLWLDPVLPGADPLESAGPQAETASENKASARLEG